MSSGPRHPRDFIVDPWVAWAAARGLVQLRDGRVARLVKWSRHGGQHKVLLDGRHQWVPNDAVVAQLAEEGA